MTQIRPTSAPFSASPPQVSTPLPDAKRRRAVGGALLAWFRVARRPLPWRETRDPYAIWVSETMLQQTQVSTVLPYFQRWMVRFPSLAALAAARDDEVLHSWQGLGYYSRARRLLECARIVVRDQHGALPRAAADLARLPGIGRYTAGAIASIAFGVPAPVVDGNVIRVLTRLEGLAGDPTRAPLKEGLWTLAASLVSRRAPGDFNQALMELGATLCMPREPRCPDCPLRALCRAHGTALATLLPELPRRAPPTRLSMAAAIVERSGRLLLVQNPRTASRWAGLWMLPTVVHPDGEASADAARRALRELVGCEAIADASAGIVRHAVTRFRVTLEGVHCRLRRRARPYALGVDAVAWVGRDELDDLAFGAPQRRLLARL